MRVAVAMKRKRGDAVESRNAAIIRRAKPSDLPALVELVGLSDARTYTVGAVERAVAGLDPGAYLAWLAFSGDRAVGCCMLEIRTLRWGQRQLRAGHWTNLYLRPDCRGMKICPQLTFAMFEDALAEGIDVVYGATRRRGMPALFVSLGMRTMGDLPVYAKPLRPVRLLVKRGGFGRASRALSAVPDAVYEAGSRCWGSRAPAGLPVEQVDWNSTGVEQLFELSCASVRERVHQVRTLGSFRRRFAGNLDGEPYLLLGARKVGRFAGGLVYRLAERLEQIRAGVIMEVFHDTSDGDAARACLLEVERRTYIQGAEVLVCLPGCNTAAVQTLRELGYVKSPETYTLVWKSLDRSADPCTMPNPSQFHFTFSDYDAF